MKERLIINNRSGKSMLEIMPYINGVIKGGRISNDGKQYSYVTMFILSDDSKIVVFSDLNKKSDRLTVIHETVQMNKEKYE